MTQRSYPGMLARMCVSGVARGIGLLITLGLVGCTGGTETGNPSFTGALSYTGYSSAPQSYAVGDGGSVASVKRAWLDLAPVQVASSGKCGLEGTEAFTVPALGVGDHAAGKHNATAFSADAGRFCSLVLPFQRVASDEPKAPAELAGHSILLQGALADGTQFSIISDLEPRFELDSDASGFELSAQQPNALIAFDFASWLRGVDFGSATPSGGQLTISRDQNAAILGIFEANLPTGIALYRDRDGDGVLDTEPELLAHAR